MFFLEESLPVWKVIRKSWGWCRMLWVKNNSKTLFEYIIYMSDGFTNRLCICLFINHNKFYFKVGGLNGKTLVYWLAIYILLAKSNKTLGAIAIVLLPKIMVKVKVSVCPCPCVAQKLGGYIDELTYGKVKCHSLVTWNRASCTSCMNSHCCYRP